MRGELGGRVKQLKQSDQQPALEVGGKFQEERPSWQPGRTHTALCVHCPACVLTQPPTSRKMPSLIESPHTRRSAAPGFPDRV